MSFKYSVIGDNTPENREHLEKLGYDISCPCVRFKTSSLFTDNDGEVHTFQEEELGECLLEIKQGKCDLINCIGNTQLFKAVSAMRSDSDYMQWFTCKVKDGLGNELPDSWVLCTQKTLQDFGWVNNSPNTYGKNTPYHKATLSELEAHFQRV